MPRASNSHPKRTTKSAGNAAENRALMEANSRLEGQINELRTQLQAAQTQATATAATAAPTTPTIVPRPTGEHGRNWNLLRELEKYDVSRREYNHMLAEVRDSAKMARLDRTLVYRAQDPIKVAQVFGAMRSKFPILKRFRSDWATAEMLKQCLKNWRSKAKALGDVPESSGSDSNTVNNNTQANNGRVWSPEI
ncbi:hypothetical protein FRC19_011841 [Serendipita sp. 401]|nr:hypothetical protein FRC15_002046 [Serendipita sp. 397]KAG8786084.1 hypothetical protein FRC16_001807 [Serendipita sp. 398]KAG8816724.1 hypothetical protein FRC19_011841 [Serendipita sp. 401]KAG8850484.1 hypothetical protein FRC20_002020 [Serendipita sp. 405]KAG9046418.1 hypothetical protein FS842_000867 [Serendipita sp. 407]